MAQNMLALSVIAVLVISVGVSAKRGCSAFGHSCFGGHGKRSDDSISMDSPNLDLMVQRQTGQEETPPHPVYPHSGYGIMPGDDIIPVRDGGVYDRDENNMRDAAAVKMKLRNILKYWMDNYRRSRLNNDEGYVIDTL